MPKIDGEKLTEDDIGRTVIYIPDHARNDQTQWEYGTLSSFRKTGAIFVKFKGPNGEMCSHENLRWGNQKKEAKEN